MNIKMPNWTIYIPVCLTGLFVPEVESEFFGPADIAFIAEFWQGAVLGGWICSVIFRSYLNDN